MSPFFPGGDGNRFVTELGRDFSGAGLALPLGALALRARGIYFLMLTLAFAQMVWSVVSNNQLAGVLGGDIGLIGVPRPVLPGNPDYSLFVPATSTP
jgi:ABC-type branched-subunit amino acid transport system permease subunit